MTKKEKSIEPNCESVLGQDKHFDRKRTEMTRLKWNQSNACSMFQFLLV